MIKPTTFPQICYHQIISVPIKFNTEPFSTMEDMALALKVKKLAFSSVELTSTMTNTVYVFIITIFSYYSTVSGCPVPVNKLDGAATTRPSEGER